MIKLILLFHRLPTLSLKDCHSYWVEKYGQLVRQHALCLQVRYYVQLHMIDDPISDARRVSRGTVQPYDGLCQFASKDPEILFTSLAISEAQQADEDLRQGEPRFADFSRSSIWLAKEHAVIA
jgi:hypothetical protein